MNDIRIMQWCLFVASFILIPINKSLTGLFAEIGLIKVHDTGYVSPNIFVFIWLFYLVVVSPPFVFVANRYANNYINSMRLGDEIKQQRHQSGD